MKQKGEIECSYIRLRQCKIKISYELHDILRKLMDNIKAETWSSMFFSVSSFPSGSFQRSINVIILRQRDLFAHMLAAAVSTWNKFVCFAIFWPINKQYKLHNELPNYMCLVGEQRCCQGDPGQSEYTLSYLANKYVICQHRKHMMSFYLS